ncbi:hypothetical protein Tco_1470822, partial [Tanacetum coccineum]
MIANPDNTTEQILEPLSKMTEGNKKQYIVDVKVMNYLLQAIPNDIYNSVDACKNAKYMWEQIKQLMFGSDVTNHKFSIPTNNRLRTSSKTRNQVVIQDGRIDIQTKNAGYGGNGYYDRDFQKPRVRDAKYFREQMLLAIKDEAGSNLKDEENDFMLDNSYEDDTLKEPTAAVIMMARIQPANDNADSEPSYDAKAVSE